MWNKKEKEINGKIWKTKHVNRLFDTIHSEVLVELQELEEKLKQERLADGGDMVSIEREIIQHKGEIKRLRSSLRNKHAKIITA